MSNVKTYDLVDTGSCYQPWREMEEDENGDGDWVGTDDYRALEKERDELRGFNKEASEMLRNVWHWDVCPDDYKERIEKLWRQQQ